MHSQSMTKLDLGQEFSCWSNVIRLRFEQHVSQLTNFEQWVTLTKIWLVACKTRPEVLYKQAEVALDSYHDMTKLWLRLDQEFII